MAIIPKEAKDALKTLESINENFMKLRKENLEIKKLLSEQNDILQQIKSVVNENTYSTKKQLDSIVKTIDVPIQDAEYSSYETAFSSDLSTSSNGELMKEHLLKMERALNERYAALFKKSGYSLEEIEKILEVPESAFPLDQKTED